jgi:hypothetical protein
MVLKLMNCDNVGFVEGVEMQLSRPIHIINDGANECLIRAVFARRGVGFAIQELVLLGLTKCQITQLIL